MKTIWVIEDNQSFRESTLLGLEKLSAEDRFRGFSTCEAALEWLNDEEVEESPDVVFMDIELPGMNGIEGMREIKSLCPEVCLVVLTVFEDDEKIFRALRAGASGYLLKSESIQKVFESIALVMEGASPLHPRVASRVLQSFGALKNPPAAGKDYGLSGREREVLQCMVEGFLRKEIAAKLDLNIHTLDYVMRGIYRKLHVQGVGPAVALAVKEGLVEEGRR